MDEEIIVSKSWFVRLSALVQRVETSQNEVDKKQAVSFLLGYLSSVETIIKYCDKK